MSDVTADGTDAMLDEWVNAKRAKDFTRADQLRASLRAQGVDPDVARPPERGTVTGHGPAIEAKLDDWVAAKRRKEFELADRLRQELRNEGVDPDRARPPGHVASGGGPGAATAAAVAAAAAVIEAKLDEWVSAKRRKEFGIADRLREELRQLGVDPDRARPAGSGGGVSSSSSSATMAAATAVVARMAAAPAQVAPWAQSPSPYDAPMYGHHMPQYQQPYVQPYMQTPFVPPTMGGPGMPASSPPVYDGATEARLEEWVAAKRAKVSRTPRPRRPTSPYPVPTPHTTTNTI